MDGNWNAKTLNSEISKVFGIFIGIHNFWHFHKWPYNSMHSRKISIIAVKKYFLTNLDN